MRGRLITFEGIDQVGKSTQARLLAQRLRDRHHLPVIETREPGGSELGEQLRTLLLHTEGLQPATQTLLHFAARQEHLKTRILPALKSGSWVICDRFTDSTRAYQGGGHGVPSALIATLAKTIENGTHPDITFYLPPPGPITALPTATDTYERQPKSFRQRVDAEYRHLAQQHPQRIITLPTADPHGKRHPPETLAEAIHRHLQPLLPPR